MQQAEKMSHTCKYNDSEGPGLSVMNDTLCLISKLKMLVELSTTGHTQHVQKPTFQAHHQKYKNKTKPRNVGPPLIPALRDKVR